MSQVKTIRPDSKGRITLGTFAKGVSSFSVHVDKSHRIILEPLVEIPAREKWLFENKFALNQVKKGIQDAATGKVTKKDFSHFLKNDDDK